MIQWLNRYIFRGTGLLFVIAIITVLYLAISSHLRELEHKPAPATHVTKNR